MTNQTELRMLAVTDLMPHPDNPRLQLREDVVDQLAAEIGRRGFGQEHALLVRPKDGGYQIISGHHRHAAAQRAGVADLPCWVREMDERQALMQLVLANTQGELSPLEIGMHALRAGRGGVVGYAEKIGKTKGYISQIRSAAEVLESLGEFSQLNLSDLLTKAMHLYEISRAPRDSWPRLVDAMLNGWSAADTSARVGELSKFDIP